MSRHGRLLSAVALLCLAFTAHAATTTQRLAALGRTWGTVKHAHPYLGSRDIRWDDAGVRAIARTMSAAGAEELAAATQEMLSAVGDPSTRVERTCVEAEATQPAPIATPPGVLYVAPGASADANAVAAATHVVFDLRPMRGRCSSANAAQLETLAPHMFSGTIAAPPHRKVQHNGYRSQNPADAEFSLYDSSFVYEGGATFTGLAASPRRTTFVVDENSTLPAVAIAMIASGQASMLSVGPYRDLAMTSQLIPLEGGYHARIRTSELTVRVAPRTTLDAGANESAIVAAAVDPPASGRRRAVRGPEQTTVEYTFRYDDPYAGMSFPAVEYRVLAAYRYWNAIRYFYGYKHLIGPWEPRLEQIIDKLAATSSQTEYELVLAEIMKYVPDGHSRVFTAAYQELRGVAAPPFQTVPAEGKVIVSALTHESASAAGIRPGDELLSIDGRPIAERLDELKRYISAAVETNLEFNAAFYAARGPEGSTATMRFRRADGTEYQATVRRTGPWQFTPAPLVAWKVLPNNIGYVNLSYLEVAEVDRMFSALAATRAIIFDMRGYPRGVFPALARRLNLTGASVVAQLRVPLVVGGELRETYRAQELARNATPSFRGKTFMLIDERSQSQAEHTGLVLEAFANTTFVGSPTSGSNGNITFAVVPGGHYVMFTGMDVRHADGRQLQRIGLVPHIAVPRTVAAIAAGRDEVLERAIELAMQP